MTLDTLSLPANGGNADTVGGKNASDFVETSKVLTTKEQIEANTDASNVAGATALKEVANSINGKMVNSSIISGVLGSPTQTLKTDFQILCLACISRGTSYCLIVFDYFDGYVKALSDPNGMLGKNVLTIVKPANSSYFTIKKLVNEQMRYIFINAVNVTITND